MDKYQLLSELRNALRAGTIRTDELRGILNEAAPSESIITSPIETPINQVESSSKLSAVEVMFYVSGIVLFVAIMAMISQSWDAGGVLQHVLLSAGVGSALWILAHVLHKQDVPSDIRKGLVNAMVLTGSLCLIVGGFIITNEAIGGFEEVNFIPGAITFAVLGAVHFAYDRKVRKDIVLLLAVLLSVATFPALLFGILQEAHLPPDVWAAVFISGALMLPYTMRTVAKMQPERVNLRKAFDSLTAFLVLFTMFIASFSEYGVIWLMLLIGSVLGLFYVSIIMQNKNLLGNASFFLVVAVLEISFKYFSGAGVSVGLLIAATGLLGAAAIATTINKKYFKDVPPSPPLSSGAASDTALTGSGLQESPHAQQSAPLRPQVETRPLTGVQDDASNNHQFNPTVSESLSDNTADSNDQSTDRP